MFDQKPKACEVTLEVDGEEYAGWTEAEITRRLDAVSGAFRLQVADRWDGASASEPFPIEEGAECVLKIDGEEVITGYIDQLNPSLDARGGSNLAVSGRDAAADLIDCDAEVKTYKNITLDSLALQLCDPFSIPVMSMTPSLELFDVWSVEPGEKVYQNLEKAARQRGRLIVSDGAGGLIILSSPVQGLADTALTEGQNIMAGEGTFDVSGRFSQYTVYAQRPVKKVGDSPAKAFQVKGEAKDAGVTRFRPCTINGEVQMHSGQALQRAQWEASIRAARSQTARVATTGWRQAGGDLWAIGLRVPVKSPRLMIDSEMLIAGVTFRLSKSGGQTVDLDLARPDAFVPKPEVPVKKLSKPSAIWSELVGGV